MKKLIIFLLTIPLFGIGQTTTNYTGNSFKAKSFIETPLIKLNGKSLKDTASLFQYGGFSPYQFGRLNTAFNKVSSQWVTSGSNIYFNLGKVGIGTDNATSDLHVIGYTSFEIPTTKKFRIRDNILNKYVFECYPDSLWFAFDGLNSGYKLGIGKNPLHRLDVLGVTNSDTLYSGYSEITNANTELNSNGNLRIKSNSDYDIDKGGQITFGGKYTSSGYANFAAIRGCKDNIEVAESSGYLSLLTTNEASYDLTEKARLTSNGFFGINKTNPTVHLDVNGNANFDGYILSNGIYAGIYVSDASTAQSIANGAAYTKSTAFTTNGLSSNCTPSASNDNISITKTGKYLVNGSFSFSSGTNNVIWKASAFLGTVEQPNIHWSRKVETAGDVGNASFTGLINVTSVPIDLDVRFRHGQAGAINITIEYANLTVVYLGK